MSTRYDEGRENAERDPRRNEAIFDGGCARFVPKEGHDFCHGKHMGIVGTIQKGPARKSKGTNLLGTPWKGASTPRASTIYSEADKHRDHVENSRMKEAAN